MTLPRVDLSNIQPKVSIGLEDPIRTIVGSERRNQKCVDRIKSNNTEPELSIPPKGLVDKWH